MKFKHLCLLVVVAGVVAGIAVWMGREPETGMGGIRTGDKAFPALAVNEVAKIELVAGGGTTTVVQVEGRWRVKERFNFPADFGKVREVVNKLAEIKVLRSVRTTPQERAELHLLTPADTPAPNSYGGAASLMLSDKAGKKLLSIWIGVPHEGPASEFGMGGYPDGRFLMTEDGAVMLVSDPLPEVNFSVREWLDPEFVSVAASDIKEITITGPTNGMVHLLKDSAGELKLQGAIPDDKVADSGKISQLANALSYLRFADVADPGLTGTQTGLEHPVTFKAHTSTGEVYQVQVGKSQDSQYYARVSVSSDKPSASARPVPEALTEKWTYLLNSANVDSLTRGFSDLLVDKPK